MTFDDLNPKFHFFSPIAAPGTNAIEHVDRAIIALDGRAPIAGDWFVEALNPLASTGTVRVELWVSDLADFTCTYGFVLSSENGSVPYARGERTVVNIDPHSRAPQTWSNEFRSAHTELLKDLPAYA